MMKRRDFLGLLAVAVGLRLKPDTITRDIVTHDIDCHQVVTRVSFIGMDGAEVDDYTAYVRRVDAHFVDVTGFGDTNRVYAPRPR